jgi:hypothetical protein
MKPYDLESLARRVRPSDDFLDLCIAPGHKRVSIGGKLVEIASYQVPGVYPLMLISLRGRDSYPALGSEQRRYGRDPSSGHRVQPGHCNQSES